MITQVKTSGGIALVPAEARLLAERRIFVEGEITQESACEFVRKMMILCGENDEPINVFINSPGGEINAGLLMYDVLQASPVPVHMYCIGRAYSMGALLFGCGSRSRTMFPHAELMLHEPLLGSSVQGSASSIQSISESLLKTKRKVNELLAARTGKTVEEIDEVTSCDHYFSAEEAQAFGLCDHIAAFDMSTKGEWK
jgi:ATP-dependent Clp protease protease subunit